MLLAASAALTGGTAAHAADSAAAPAAPRPSSPAVVPAAAAPRALLVGQSNTGAWNDLTFATGADPQGGSVYYSVRDGGFSGACGTGCETDYASFLADRVKQIEVGVSWKDNPPGWDGDNADKQAASQQATAAVATGAYDRQFAALGSFIAAHPSATFLVLRQPLPAGPRRVLRTAGLGSLRDHLPLTRLVGPGREFPPRGPIAAR